MPENTTPSIVYETVGLGFITPLPIFYEDPPCIVYPTLFKILTTSSGVLIAKSEHISHLFVVSPLLTLNK